MSSSNSSCSSLDWVLSHSHWAHFIVRRYICVYMFMYFVDFYTAHVSCYCEHSGMDLVELKLNP